MVDPCLQLAQEVEEFYPIIPVIMWWLWASTSVWGNSFMFLWLCNPHTFFVNQSLPQHCFRCGRINIMLSPLCTQPPVLFNSTGTVYQYQWPRVQGGCPRYLNLRVVHYSSLKVSYVFTCIKSEGWNSLLSTRDADLQWLRLCLELTSQWAENVIPMSAFFCSHGQVGLMTFCALGPCGV